MQLFDEQSLELPHGDPSPQWGLHPGGSHLLLLPQVIDAQSELPEQGLLSPQLGEHAGGTHVPC